MPVKANLNSLEFNNLKVIDFAKVDFYKSGFPGKYVKFDFTNYENSHQGLIYGTIGVVYLGKGIIMALPDIYNFDVKFNSSFKRVIRDLATIYRGIINTMGLPGKPYHIYFQGTSKINR